MKYSAYPKYRPGGVEWLGDVPDNWEVKRVSLLARQGKNTFTDGDWIELPYITTEGVRLLQTGNIGVGAFKEQGFRYIEEETLSELRCTEVLPGDVLICRLADPVGRACLAPNLGCRMITSVDVCILKAANYTDPRYLVYFFSSKPYLDFVDSLCRGGTRDRISRSMLGAIRSLLPPVSDQRAIADFLDTETAKLDTLVGKKQALIEKLRERRTALVSRTVTRGLLPEAARAAGRNPCPKLKFSGVDWLGEVPEHWEVKRLKYIATINDETLPETTDSSFEFTYVDISSVDPVAGVVARERMEFENAPSRARRIARDGDTIVSTVRTYLRAIAPIKEPTENLIVSTGFAVVRPRSVEANFLSYALRESGFVETVVARSVGVSYPAVNASDVATIPIPLPPTTEQRAIADYLDRETAMINRMVAKVESAIERLQEYRTALITAAVTGKIDVRTEL